jgi:sigma-E factor negative regulatory protein RseA
MARRDDEDKRQRLSLLLDGDASPDGAEDACAAWRDDGELRAAWHVYHLIGDVMRSEDLARPAARDAAFLASLRGRLKSEPVILSPQAASARPAPQRARRRSWIGPAATAAGFAAVAAVLVTTRVATPDDESTAVLARSPAGVLPVAASAALFDGSDAQPLLADGKLIRDAHLDRYLAAHKQYGDSSAVVLPGIVLRSSTSVPPAR